MTAHLGRAQRILTSMLFLVGGGSLADAMPAQIIGKQLRKQADAERPEGKWQGTARESVGGSMLEYPIELEFSGADDALQLDVRGTARVPVDGGTQTVSLRARYSGSFRAGELAMRSEAIEVRIVETGQQLPSSPQRVEARIEGGVLTGRVGSDAEGWATFSAKPSGAAATPEPAAAAATFSGRWRGSAREPGPDGRELSYEVVVDFQGEASDLRATVAADLQYPIEGGGTTPVEYRASFRGRAQAGELQLRSEQIRIRLVAHDHTETAPPQELKARLVDGLLVGTVGTAGEPPSHFELRRDDGGGAAATPGADAPARDVVTTATAYPTLVLERREITDPAMGGVVSHTMSLPRGWQFAGGASWTGNPDHIVDFVGELRGPADESLHLVGDRTFRYERVQSQQGTFDNGDGRRLPDGATARHAPKQPGEVAVEVLIPQLRPGAERVELVAAERLPKLEEALRALLKPQLDMIDAMIAQSRNQPMPGMRADSQQWLVVERARVRYREGGVDREEEFQYSLLGFHATIITDIMHSENGTWTLGNIRTARAKSGELDSRLGVLWMCADSVRETPRWSFAVNEIRLEIARAKTRASRANLEEIRRRGEQAAKDRADLSDMQMASWRARQDSLDRVHEAQVDAIAERQDFRSTDGGIYTTTNHYDRAFREPGGVMILTNDPNYRPSADPVLSRSTWEELQRVDPFRR